MILLNYLRLLWARAFQSRLADWCRMLGSGFPNPTAMFKWSLQSRSVGARPTSCWNYGDLCQTSANSYDQQRREQSCLPRGPAAYLLSVSKSSFFARRASRKKRTSALTTRFWRELPRRLGRARFLTMAQSKLLMLYLLINFPFPYPYSVSTNIQYILS